MPHKNIKERRKYSREYARKNPIKLTDEQKKAKSEYMKEYRKKNTAQFKRYQHDRYERDKEQIALRQKEYRERNDEKIKAKKKIYYQENKEYFNKKASQYYNDNKNSIREYKKLYGHRVKCRFSAYQRSADKRGYDFNLSYEQFETLFNKDCHYCGVKHSKGVDRADNTIGYTPDNSVPCCKICNYMKRDTPYEEFKAHIKTIFSNLNS